MDVKDVDGIDGEEEDAKPNDRNKRSKLNRLVAGTGWLLQTANCKIRHGSSEGERARGL